MADEKRSAEGSMRWWEFYAVRYAMGTVVGAIMLWLLFSLSPVLRPLLLGPAESDTALAPLMKLDAGQLSVLGIGGLVFCYVASAPILVLHAGRFLLAVDTVRLGRWWVWCLALVIPASLSILIVWQTTPLSVGSIVLGLLAFMLLSVVGVQWVAAILTLAHPSLMFAFYDQLATAREESGGGITDSYRHLREHGNSFFIVMLEVLLGVLLIGVGTATESGADSGKHLLWFLVIFVVWTVPAVSVWLAATLLESEFSHSSTRAHSRPSQSVAVVGSTPASPGCLPGGPPGSGPA